MLRRTRLFLAETRAELKKIGLTMEEANARARIANAPYKTTTKGSAHMKNAPAAGGGSTVRDMVGKDAGTGEIRGSDSEGRAISVQSMNRSHQIMKAGTYENEVKIRKNEAQGYRVHMYNLQLAWAFFFWIVIYAIWIQLIKPVLRAVRERNERLQDRHEQIFKPAMKRYIAEVKRRKLEDQARIAAGMEPLYPDMKPRVADDAESLQAQASVVDVNTATENRHGWFGGLRSSYKRQKYLSPVD